MVTLIIVAHAPLASAFEAVAAHTFPERRAEVLALDLHPDTPEPQRALLALLSPLADQEVLVLTDVFGATPCRVSMEVAQRRPRTRVLAGVNAPMLWRALAYRDLPLDEVADRAAAGAVQGVMAANMTPRQNQPTPPLRDDPVHHHDQQ